MRHRLRPEKKVANQRGVNHVRITTESITSAYFRWLVNALEMFASEKEN